ncbi:MAG: hypothetical protein GX456_08655 [Verrucomicrobia bacterium]|nr:hypothetical protein [Verrucomicrobiota bacterium]
MAPLDRAADPDGLSLAAADAVGVGRREALGVRQLAAALFPCTNNVPVPLSDSPRSHWPELACDFGHDPVTLEHRRNALLNSLVFAGKQNFDALGLLVLEQRYAHTHNPRQGHQFGLMIFQNSIDVTLHGNRLFPHIRLTS